MRADRAAQFRDATIGQTTAILVAVTIALAVAAALWYRFARGTPVTPLLAWASLGLIGYVTATFLAGLLPFFRWGSGPYFLFVIGAALAYTLLSMGSDVASAQLGVGWLNDAPSRLVRTLLGGPYGLDALITAGLESLGTSAKLTTGERIQAWLGVPNLARWGIATLIWTGAGILALWAAASRHRERRGA